MDSVVKDSLLHLQHHILGKKCWRKTRALLFSASQSGVARIEAYEVRDGCPKDRSSLKKSERRVLRLADCVSILRAEGESCPRGTQPFYFNTTDKTHVLAAEDREEWMDMICQLAFQSTWGQERPLETGKERRPLEGVLGDCAQSGGIARAEVIMKDNAIYSSCNNVSQFQVVVQKSETSERCGLSGRYTLELTQSSVNLKENASMEVLYVWPYPFLRRFGGDKETFYFESGRRCQSGEGVFTFFSSQSCEIYSLISSAIKCQEEQAQGPSHDARPRDTRPCSVIGLSCAETSDSPQIDFYSSCSWTSVKRVARGSLGMGPEAEARVGSLAVSEEMEQDNRENGSFSLEQPLDIPAVPFKVLKDTPVQIALPVPAADPGGDSGDPLYAVITKIPGPVMGLQGMEPELGDQEAQHKEQGAQDLHRLYDNLCVMEASLPPEEVPPTPPRPMGSSQPRPQNGRFCIDTPDHHSFSVPQRAKNPSLGGSLLTTPLGYSEGHDGGRGLEGADGAEAMERLQLKVTAKNSFKMKLTTLLAREPSPKGVMNKNVPSFDKS